MKNDKITKGSAFVKNRLALIQKMSARYQSERRDPEPETEFQELEDRIKKLEATVVQIRLSNDKSNSVDALMVSKKFPSELTMQEATKLSLELNKVIRMDYFMDVLNGLAWLGKDTVNNIKILIKSANHYTSAIIKIYRCCDEYILITENSIYIVPNVLKQKVIKAY